MDLLDRMLGHDHWATAQLLERCAHLTDAQLDQEFDLGHRTLRETLDHMIYVIDFWTGWMSGRPVAHDRTTQTMTARSPRSLNVTSASSRASRHSPARCGMSGGWTTPSSTTTTFASRWAPRSSSSCTTTRSIVAKSRHMLERLGVPDLWDYDPQEWEHVTKRV